MMKLAVVVGCLAVATLVTQVGFSSLFFYCVVAFWVGHRQSGILFLGRLGTDKNSPD